MSSLITQRLNLGIINRYYKKLIDLVFSYQLFNEKVTKDTINVWTTTLIQAFGANAISGKLRNAIYASLTGYIGQTLDTPTLRKLARRIATNHDNLLKGIPVQSWSGYIDDKTYTLIEFIDCEQQGEQVTYTVEVIYGPAAGEQLKKTISIMSTGYSILMYKLVGKKHSGSPRELIGLKLWVILCKRDHLTFIKWEITDNIITLNRAVLTERRKPCINGFTHLCVNCPIGRDLCARGCCPTTPEDIVLTLRGLNVKHSTTDERSPEPVPTGGQNAVDEPGT